MEINNVLFIGGAGFIGSNLIKTLLRRDSRVKIFVIEPIMANISRLNGLPITIFRCSLDDIDQIETIIIGNKIETVVHLVSTLIPGSNFDDYKREIQNVAFPTFRITQLCSERGVKFVYFSSGGTVYGNRKDATPFVETDSRNPISYYGLTKLMLENNILFEHRTQGLKYLILRPSNPYGHGQALNGRQGFIAVAIGRVLKNEKIEVWGDGSNIRDYIYIDDLANIFCSLLEKDTSNEIVNIGSGIGYSINDILDAVTEVTNRKLDVVYKPNRDADVSTMILSTKKLHSIVDYKGTSLHDGLRIFYDEEKLLINK